MKLIHTHKTKAELALILYWHCQRAIWCCCRGERVRDLLYRRWSVVQSIWVLPGSLLHAGNSHPVSE